MDAASRETLLEINRLLWSIGDALDEMDHTGKDMWPRIEAIEKRICEIAGTLSECEDALHISREIMERRNLYLWWSSIHDKVKALL